MNGLTYWSDFFYGPRFFAGPSAPSIRRTIWPMSINSSVIPAAIAGIVFSVVWVLQKLYQTKYSASA